MTIELRNLPQVSSAAVGEYTRLSYVLVESVNARMSGREDLTDLIGSNSVEVMYENHRHHAAFMASVFQFGIYGLLSKTLPWVYRAYHSRGFSHAYFSAVMTVWIDVIREFMDQSASDILTIYEWMLTRHEETVQLSLRPAIEPDAGSPVWQLDYERFRDALLIGDVSVCLEMAQSRVDTAERMVDFFVHVLQPAMQAVGARWENGLISVAQEHLASAIVSRILASISTSGFSSAPTRGTAVVSAAANEFHEIGAWMLASCLESDGWDVQYLGANTPCSDLLDFVHSEKPDLLCISVAMIFNIGAVKTVIDGVRSQPDLDGMRVLVGGQALLHDPDIFHVLKADAMATDCKSAMNVARALISRRASESRLS